LLKYFFKTFSRPQTFCDFSMTQIKSGDLLQPIRPWLKQGSDVIGSAVCAD